MKRSLLMLLLAVPLLLAASVEVGSAQFPNNKPFCAN